MKHIEARLVVPLAPNKGSDLSPATYRGRLGRLERNLIRLFGGFTSYDGHGAYDNGDTIQYEKVRVYLLGFEGVANDPVLHYLRNTVKERLDQRAVYLSHTLLEDEPVQ
jgi:hypothetical protein